MVWEHWNYGINGPHQLVNKEVTQTVVDLETEEPNQKHAVGLFKLEQNRKKNNFMIHRVLN